MAKHDPQWNLYRSFLAVMSEGSLSAAARGLAMTQPSLGRHIRELETALGVDLFARSPQGLVPTDMAYRTGHGRRYRRIAPRCHRAGR